MAATKEFILGVVQDAVADLLYYNRKEDEELPVGAIEEAIKDGVLTVEEIVREFKADLINAMS